MCCAASAAGTPNVARSSLPPICPHHAALWPCGRPRLQRPLRLPCRGPGVPAGLCTCPRAW
eukprot:4007687-Pyramimonas_sp.AAC.1